MSLASRLQTRKDRIRSHIGFRWVAEALVGGDLGELDPEAFHPLMKRIENPTFDIKQLADRVKSKLKQNRPVLVGHNIFCDLLFFHRCFIGPLPNSLQEFKAAIHDLFPVVADTKYLVTHDCGALAPESSLEDLNRNLANIENPKIGIVLTVTLTLVSIIDHISQRLTLDSRSTNSAKAPTKQAMIVCSQPWLSSNWRATSNALLPFSPVRADNSRLSCPA
jgi:hypothetical protein